jgi:hypothetical protein
MLGERKGKSSLGWQCSAVGKFLNGPTGLGGELAKMRRLEQSGSAGSKRTRPQPSKNDSAELLAGWIDYLEKEVPAVTRVPLAPDRIRAVPHAGLALGPGDEQGHAHAGE